MNSLAISLVLGSALLHAFWNLLSKRAEGGAAFVWLYATVALLAYTPVAGVYVFWTRSTITAAGAWFILLSSVLHLLYFLVLQRGYRRGDLSLVYPLARGVGPTLATIAAIVILGERPAPAALAGAGMVIVGVVLLTSGGQAASRPAPAGETVVFGLVCGVLIAAYTVCDKFAVTDLGVSPVLLPVLYTAGIFVMLAPHAMRQWSEVKSDWAEHRWEVIGVALMYPAAYLMVLAAMKFTPLSYVAPAREISILFGAVLGSQFLGEGHTLRRLLAAAAMVTGMFVLMMA